MNPPSQAVIFCGGRGERLRPLTDNLPKPMAQVLGRPFLDYLIEQLSDAGIKRVLLLTGYLGHQIADHFGRGEKSGVDIEYGHGPAEWETGRRLAEARGLLDERFVLMYGDNLAPFVLDRVWESHVAAAGEPALTLTVARKEKGNMKVPPVPSPPEGRVPPVGAPAALVYDPTRTQAGLTHVEIGYMIAQRDPIMALDPARGSFSLTIQALAESGRLSAFDPGCSYRSISDLGRLRETEEFLRPRKLILIDRDGVLNRKAPRAQYVSRKEDFHWIEDNLAGVEALAREGFEFIILSNQAGIGRGVITRQAVDELHAWMTAELAARGVRIRDVLLCPHHWEDRCTCRKPEPGLFFEASEKHRFWLGRTIYIGDDPRDALAAHNAACPCLLVGEDSDVHDWPGRRQGQTLPAHERARNLADAVPWIVRQFKSWEEQHEGTKTRSNTKL
jgi:D-glycero-D-manno-heptose 1,7-bisphosphate phosphatase